MIYHKYKLHKATNEMVLLLAVTVCVNSYSPEI